MLKTSPRTAHGAATTLTMAAAAAGLLLFLAITFRYFDAAPASPHPVEPAAEQNNSDTPHIQTAALTAPITEHNNLLPSELDQQNTALAALNDQLHTLQAQLAEHQAEAEALIAERSHLEAENERLRNDVIVPLEQQLASLEASQELDPIELEQKLDRVQRLLDDAISSNNTVNAELRNTREQLNSMTSEQAQGQPQLKQLSAEQARQFDNDMQLRLSETSSQFGQEIEQLNSQISALNSQLSASKLEQESLMDNLADINRNNTDLNTQLAAAQQELKDNLGQHTESSEKSDALLDKLDFATGERDNLAFRLQEAEKTHTAFEAEAIQQATDKQTTIYRLEEKLAALQSSREETVSALDTRIATLVGDIKSTTTNRSALSERMEALQKDSAQLIEVQRQLEQANNARDTLALQQETLQQQLLEQQSILTEAQSALEAQKAANTAIEQQLATVTGEQKEHPLLRQELEGQVQALAEMQQQRDAIDTQLKELQSQQKETAPPVSAQAEKAMGEQATLRGALDVAHAELEKLRNSTNAAASKLPAMETQLAELTQSTHTLKAQLDEQKENNTALAEQSQTLLDSLNQWKKTAEELEQERDQLLTSASQNPDIEKLKTELSDLEIQLSSKEQEQSQLSQNFSTEMASLNTKVSTLNSERQTLFNDLESKRHDLLQLRETLEKTETELSSTREQLTTANSKLSSNSEAPNRQLAPLQLTQHTREQLGDIDGLKTTDKQNGSIVIKLPSSALYRLGSARLSPQGKALMTKVGNSLKGLKNKINAEGHTDNISLAAASRYSSNWELASARANNVTRFLHEEVGIDASRLAAIGYGEYRPAAPNDTPANRQLNRRVEIRLLPLH